MKILGVSLCAGIALFSACLIHADGSGIGPAAAGRLFGSRHGEGSSIEFAARFPGDDIGDRVNAAVRACRHTGCMIILPAGNFDYHETIRLDVPGVSLEGMGAVPTHLHYKGAGSGILIEEGGTPPFIQGRLGNLYLDGDGNSGYGVAGIRLVNTIGFVFGDGLAVWNFTGDGDSGILLQNRPPDYCLNCSSGFSERTSFEQVSLGNNNVELQFQSTPGSVNSFEFTMIRDLHLQIMDGQTGIDVKGTGTYNSAVLANSILDVASNVWDPGTPATFIRAEQGGGIFNNHYVLIDEETNGKHEIPYEVSDSESTLVFGDSSYVPNQTVQGASHIRGTFRMPRQ